MLKRMGLYRVFPVLLAGLTLIPACSRSTAIVPAPGSWSYHWSADTQEDPLAVLIDPSTAWTATEKIWNPPGREDRSSLWLRLQLNDHEVPDPALLLQNFDQIGEVFVQRKTLQHIYSFGKIDPDGAVVFSGYPFHIVHLNPADRLIYFQIRSNHINAGITGEPLLGRASELLTTIVRQDLDRLIMALWILLAGLFSGGLFLRDRSQKHFGAFASVCFTIGTYVLASSDIKQIILDAPYFWILVELGTLYLFPASLYFQFSVLLGDGLYQHRRWLLILQLVYTAGALALALTGIVPLMQTLLPGQLLLLLMCVLLIGGTGIAAYQGAREPKIVLLGLVASVIPGSIDILTALGLMPWTGRIAHYGLLGFMSALAYILIQRVTTSGKLLEKTGRYLNRVIRELDATVAFRTEDLQRSRDEIERISDFAKQINASTELDTILERIFKYFNLQFGIEAVILQLVDKRKNELYTYHTTAPRGSTQEMIDYSRNMRFPLNESSGIIYKTYKRKRAFYLAKVDDRAFPHGTERDIIDNLDLKSFALLPLTIGGEVIAMILLTSYDKQLRLSRDQMTRIDRFADQISGAINHANLLSRAETARKQAQEERQRATDARIEVEIMNRFSREISSNTNLDEILNQIFFYVTSQFNLFGCYLYLLDDKTDELYHFKSMLPDDLDREKVEIVRNRRVPLDSESLVASVCRRKKPLYLPRFRNSGGTAEDFSGIEALGLQSIFLVPLLVQDEVRGMMVFSNFDQPMMLLKPYQDSIVRFCEQIAGAIRTASLLAQVDEERKKSDQLLLNVLPEPVANELKEKGSVEPQEYESAAILFTDFKSFTSTVESLEPRDLIVELDQIFEQFDHIVENNGLEKLKTIGDAYMCAGGLPKPNYTHAIDACLAAMEIQAFMEQTREIKKQITGEDFWELRIGIHAGPVVAGVVGKNKFVYDVWGDTVNVAARMESNGKPNRINISRETYEQIKYFFICEFRGQLQAKNRGFLDMYFLDRIRPELSRDPEGRVPNEKFRELYAKIESGARVRFRSEVNP